jgi:hypothetical protein
MMNALQFLTIAILCLIIACQSSVDPQKTKEEISPKARLDEEGYTKAEWSNKAVLQIQNLADKLCSGTMGVKEIMDFELEGHSIKHFIDQDISTFKEKDLKAYSEARAKLNCCLEAITKDKACEYMP